MLVIGRNRIGDPIMTYFLRKIRFDPDAELERVIDDQGLLTGDSFQQLNKNPGQFRYHRSHDSTFCGIEVSVKCEKHTPQKHLIFIDTLRWSGMKSAAEEKISVFEKADDDIGISDVGGDQHQTFLGSRIRSPER